ncbi:hypothetical protein SUGI_0669720 [Cryptomeria japonica]|nr:hypothetical protein SUGI_0669720 [Cryptomeria japonica]
MDLINRLPQDIFTEIIIRLPYRFHNTLKQVCKKWKDMVESDRLYQARIKSGKSEKFICVLHQAGISMYDPVHGSWHDLPPLLPGFKPSCYSSRLVWWGRKLVVMGLEHDKKFRSVLVYDFGSAGWREGQEEPEGSRDYWQFGYCASAQGIVYVPPSKAYMIAEDEWEANLEMPGEDELPSGVSIARMAYIFEPFVSYPRLFDPNVGKWVILSKFIIMDVVSGTQGWDGDRYKQLCSRMDWDRIFWYGPPSHSQKFYMFKAHKPISERWIEIQKPVNSSNLRACSATTIEI